MYMNYRIIRSDELYHHGVKGMKWGVRKADYNTKGMKSTDIYKRIDEIGRQERGAKIQNFKDYRSHKKEFKQEIKAQKKAKEITKAEYTAKKREGINAAKNVFRNNNNKIHSNFNEVYYNQIKAGDIARARNKNAWANLFDWSGDAQSQISYNEDRLKKAEARRDEFARDYAMKNYKPKR